MLKSSGSSYQFEARLGGRHISVNPRFILADDYNRPLLRYLPQTRHAQSTIDAVLRQPTTLVSRRCGALVSVRCVSSLQATQLVWTKKARLGRPKLPRVRAARPNSMGAGSLDTASEDNRHSNRHA